MARSMISAESSASVLPPNIMHPRQISLTFTPVLPRFLYSTIRSFEVVVAFFNIPRQRQRNFRGLIPRFRVCSITACGSGLVRQRREGRAHVVRKFRWGILGTGAIAKQFVQGLRSLPEAHVFAVGSRSEASAAKFADRRNIPRRHASYEDLASDPDVDVVYIATPHPFHAQNATLCLQAGKAVLCEKPFCVNAAEAERVVELARKKRLFIMEGMWTRFFPLMEEVRRLVSEGAIGEVRMLNVDFGFRAELDPASRLFDQRLGGGALLEEPGSRVEGSLTLGRQALTSRLPSSWSMKVEG